MVIGIKTGKRTNGIQKKITKEILNFVAFPNNGKYNSG